MQSNVLFQFAVLLFCGLIFSKIIRRFKLPDVTGYLVGGLLIGPSVLGILTAEAVGGLSLISEIALGFIAFSIGGEFKLSYFKRVGATPIVIAFFESLMAVAFVFAGLLLCGQPLPLALVLSAIAAATAPAATVMVIRQYKAKGPVTETLLSVVALDDAVALIAFGLCSAIASMLISDANGSLLLSLAKPLWEILLALLIGAIIGFLFSVAIRFFHHSSNKMILTIAVILVTSAVAQVLNISALLTTVMTGAVFSNLYKDAQSAVELCDRVTPPIFMMFFVLSGAGLNLSVLPSIGLIGVVYIVFRVAGKLAGAWLGATIVKADSKIKKYLGPALLPQAGVAIGLTVVAQSIVPLYASKITAVILCATLIYELFGPAVSKWTLQKAGEIEAE